jgi:hypothetical protein
MIMYKYMHFVYNMHHKKSTFKIESEQDVSIYENLFVFINMYIFAYVNIHIFMHYERYLNFNFYFYFFYLLCYFFDFRKEGVINIHMCIVKIV